MNQLKLEHIGICVKDIETSIEWYKNNFGFKEIKRFEKAEFEINAAIMQWENLTIEILQPYTGHPLPENDNSLKACLRNLGINHFAVSVNDVKSFYEQCKNNNITLITELVKDRFFFCKDPDGTLIEVKQFES